jgi:hypothetical protein
MKLPSHRHIQAGRTHSSIYDPADYTPITGPYRHSNHWRDFTFAIIAVAAIAIVFITN